MKPTLTPEQYALERAIRDKARAFWNANATFSRSGWSSMGPELAAHPDYASCDNAMRGRVEHFELLTATPDRFSAYVSSDGKNVTTWTGDILGTCYLGTGWRVQSYVGSRLYQATAWINGREYTGRTSGTGCLVNLRLTAAARKIAA